MKRKRIYRRILLTLLQIFIYFSFIEAQSVAIPDGYADYAGTTGGGSATPVTVSTASEFKAVIGNDNPAVVIVSGRLNVGTVSIGSNKTIIGIDINAGLYGGVIQIRGSNYIIQNLTFGPSGDDVLEVSGATKVFITKCSFHDSSDELCSIVREADYVTVSWCKFYFDEPDGHSFAHLIGNSDSRTSDRGKLHVTMHHNWYAEGVRGRMPRVRFGHVHLYNNFYNSVGNGYCVGVGKECNIRMENMHFEGVDDPWADYGGVTNGKTGWNDLKFVDCSEPTFVPNSYPVFDVPYTYKLDPVESVKSIVQAGAGNVPGGANNSSIEVAITSPVDSASYGENQNITIEVDASVEDSEIAYVQFYADTLLGTDSIAPFSFEWENVDAGIYKIFAMAGDTSGSSAISKIITVFSGDGVIIREPVDGTEIALPADNIIISADAWVSEGSISGVSFFNDTVLLGVVNNPPYSFTWQDAPSGTQSIIAIAYDKSNNMIASDTVSIVVPERPIEYEYHSLKIETINAQGTELIKTFPAGNMVDGKLMFIKDSAVVVIASSSLVSDFDRWHNNETSDTIVVLMDSDKEITAYYNTVNYIVAWDLYKKGSINRPADYYSSAENQDASLSLLREDGANTTFGVYSGDNKLFGKNAAMIRRSASSAGDYFFQINFNASDYENIRINANMLGLKTYYTIQNVEYSVDGTNFFKAGEFNLEKDSVWYFSSVQLPEDVNGSSSVVVRFKADKGSTLVTNGIIGTSISEIVVLADDLSTFSSEIKKNQSQISEIQYYTLEGKQLKFPKKGIIIKATLYDDGSKKSEKIFFKGY